MLTVLFIVHIMPYNFLRNKKQNKEITNMKLKYAVALMKGGNESILGVFDTKEEADRYGNDNIIPKESGLQYCFSSAFAKGRPVGKSIKVYTYYNV